MKYISIDGDDIGRKITSCYLSNDHLRLAELSQSLQDSTKAISTLLQEHGFDIIFCAADGVVASTESAIDLNSIFTEIRNISPDGLTFSAGSGENLRECYIALMSAKSNGKNCLHDYSKIDGLIEDQKIV
ncbi:MAG: mCpol domain-containing protein [Gammaproteobacteria bacterium]|nr:mCpol domain-containing protein [Gammaproteobacteria bacterium]MBU1556372.1 mCpol domain-containing protein [Gammaproteobacteria bacterium]MBU2068992.1 mCpol domain-containing protein [Gammaproteobacteria bacterium]MBU2183215.1 mCpol domain-containing protein [Gammaproteobacteria bacterium]MBU2204595.1 mCpol domain-containing protein [Gammaproteobacteria bacterium]